MGSICGAVHRVRQFSAGTGNPTCVLFGLGTIAPCGTAASLYWTASGTAKAVINNYGTGLDTSSFIPRLTRIQRRSCCALSAMLFIWVFLSDRRRGLHLTEPAVASRART